MCRMVKPGPCVLRSTSLFAKLRGVLRMSTAVWLGRMVRPYPCVLRSTS